MKIKSQKSKARGFTLIEMMISVGIFTIVMIFGVGALLSSNQSYRQSHNLQKIIDNLNFTIEDMARSLRVGTSYVCGGAISITGDFPEIYSFEGIGFGGSASCPGITGGGGSILFESSTGDIEDEDDQYGYLMLYNNDTNIGKLYKTVDGGEHWLIITPPSVTLDPLATGFVVTGADPSTGVTGDTLQPAVLVRLSGVVKYGDVSTPFHLQTTVSQRALDM